MNEEHENDIQFVESGEEAAEALETAEQPFDLVAQTRRVTTINTADFGAGRVGRRW